MSERIASCLCGGVKLQIHGDPIMKNTCHCSSCQKFTGAAFASVAVYKTDQVTYTESEPSALKTFDDTTPDSGGVLQRSFCGKCGSPLKVQSADRLGVVVVPVGIIDGDKATFKPEIEFYCKDRADWIGAIDNAKPFEAMPPTYPADN